MVGCTCVVDMCMGVIRVTESILYIIVYLQYCLGCVDRVHMITIAHVLIDNVTDVCGCVNLLCKRSHVRCS